LIDFVDSNRKLVREGPLKRLTRSGVIKYYFHLFNDLLLYSEGDATSKAFKLHRRIELLTTLVTDRPHSAEVTLICSTCPPFHHTPLIDADFLVVFNHGI
jgi:hypothetical protein